MGNVVKTRQFGFIVFLLSALVGSTSADEVSWRQFRGPSGDGHANAELPTSWSETKNVRWKTAIPGEGHSSPVIDNKQIWITTALQETLSPEEEKRRLSKLKNPRGLKLAGKLKLLAVCLDAESGDITKQIELFEIDEPEPKHQLNSYASPSPVLGDNRLYCHFGTYGTVCVDTQTNEIVWKANSVHADHQNGPGSSPVLWNGLLIVHFDGIDTQSIAALDAATGHVKWRTTRSGEMDKREEFRKAYCTPLVLDDVDGKPLLISPAANWLYGYEPETGRELWKVHYGKLGFSTVPRPVFAHGMVYVATSYLQSRLLAIQPGQDEASTKTVWTSDKQVPQKPSVVVVGDELYMISDRGIATCLDAKSGEQIWQKRIAGNYSSSLLHANGFVYFFNQSGTTSVIKAGRTYKEPATNSLDEGFMASPSVIGNALILRTSGHVYRIENE